MEKQTKTQNPQQITRKKVIACGICTGVAIASIATAIVLAFQVKHYDESTNGTLPVQAQVPITTTTTTATTTMTTTVSDVPEITTTTLEQPVKTTYEFLEIPEKTTTTEVTLPPQTIPGIELVTTINSYEEPEEVEYESYWSGDVLTPSAGSVQGPSGREVYYSADMSLCVQNMWDMGFAGSWYVRYDGVQMFSDYVMVAANLDYRPKGTIVETSLGTGIVVDGCEAAAWEPDLVDISVTW